MAVDSAEGGLQPAEFSAMTVKVYRSPGMRSVSVIAVAIRPPFAGSTVDPTRAVTLSPHAPQA